MRRLLTVLILCCAALLGGAAQGRMDALMAQLDTSLVSFDYRYRSEGDIPVEGSGRITVEGRMYRSEGNGLKIWSDGTTRWTVDPSSREAYIENVADSPDILSNPAPYLKSLSDVKADGSRISGIWTAPDGTRMKLSISNVEIRPRSRDATGFSFDVRSLDSTWVVSDLR